jgi:Glycosyltransferases involved in cell wall biogenesis
MDDILVSVIASVYNCEESLERSINSIINQTYHNLEIILCDDCSTDNTYALLQKIKRNDTRIILIKNDINLGLAASLNKCLLLASGLYIARMDGDDVSHPDRIEKQLTYLLNNRDIDFCGSSLNMFDNNGVYGYRKMVEFVAKKDFLFTSPFAHPTLLIPKHCLESVGYYREDKKIGRSEDYDLFMRLYAHGFVGYNFPEPLFDYYEASDSFKKRKYRYAYTEFLTRIHGFRLLHLMPIGFVYALKPLAVSMVPKAVQKYFRKKIFGRQYANI